MRCLFLVLLMSSLTAWAQSSSSLPDAPSPQPSTSPSSSSQSPSSQAPDSRPSSSSGQTSDSPSSAPAKASQPRTPDLSPPRSDRISADSIEEGSSSSKDTQIDLSPPANDAKTHPDGSDAVTEAESADARRGGDVSELHPWNPHKAAKDVEVGDFYFRRKNYVAAEDRYREALYYKDNDATATFRLAVCLERLNRPDEARQEYESYLKILPYGPESHAAQKAIEKLKASVAAPKAAK